MSEFFKYAEIPTLNVSGRRRFFGESGSALVEFALSAAAIFALFFGIIQFGRALYTYQYVNEVARELTRYAIVRGNACTAMPNCGFTDSDTTLQAYARATYTYPGMDVNQLTVTNTWYSPILNTNGTINIGASNKGWAACGSGSGCNHPGDMIKVNITYPFPLNIPFWKATTLNVTSSSSMIISQ